MADREGYQNRIQLLQGTLDLHRMEQQKWVRSKWRFAEQNQRPKFYQLTAEVNRQLARDRSKWEAMVQAIAGVLNPAPQTQPEA